MAIRMFYHLSEKGGSHLEFDNVAVAVATGLWYFSSSDIFMALKRKPTQGSFPNTGKKNFTCAAYALIITEIALGLPLLAHSLQLCMTSLCKISVRLPEDCTC